MPEDKWNSFVPNVSTFWASSLKVLWRDNTTVSVLFPKLNSAIHVTWMTLWRMNIDWQDIAHRFTDTVTVKNRLTGGYPNGGRIRYWDLVGSSDSDGLYLLSRWRRLMNDNEECKFHSYTNLMCYLVSAIFFFFPAIWAEVTPLSRIWPRASLRIPPVRRHLTVCPTFLSTENARRF